MERIHNGALGLLGFFLAIFSFVFTEARGLGDLPLTARPFVLLSYWFGFLIVLCGSVAIISHIRREDEAPDLLSKSYLSLLICSAVTPILLSVLIWVL